MKCFVGTLFPIKRSREGNYASPVTNCSCQYQSKESQMLNEKYALERKFSELLMALGEEQNEVIASASNEWAQRKGDLEVILNLLNELKHLHDQLQSKIRNFTSLE